MPSLPHDELVTAIEHAIASSGYSGAIISPRDETPTTFLLNGPNVNSLPVQFYIRNFTPAHRTNPDEYRIQLQTSLLPLARNAYGPTVLLGYYAADKLFVGFDLDVSATGSTQLSVGYVSLRIVRRARRAGMTFDRDRNERIAVGMRPDMLVPYCLHSTEIHDAADDNQIIALLGTAATAFERSIGGGDDGHAQGLSKRQRLLRSVSTFARDAGFRNRVLSAYGNRCAISGVQLGLVEAAHILPVCAPGSTDEVTNGLSLLPHYHRAYDSGLIYLGDDYTMRVNSARVQQLREAELIDGIDDLERGLGRVRLPASRRAWPNRTLIQRANGIRGIDVA